MPLNVQFSCPGCGRPGRTDCAVPTTWRCPDCDHLLSLPGLPGDAPLTHCQACGNQDLYRKKDFPHWLGLSLLAVACVGSFIPHWLYMPWWTWTILIGTAIFDGVLYLLVGDVVVCYRCDAHHRHYPSNTVCPPHELGIAERYRQERIRRDQLQAANKRP